jgi:hypothetical protein
MTMAIDWNIRKDKTTGMWWTELDGEAIAESSSLEMAAEALERKVKPRLPPYWTIQIYVPTPGPAFDDMCCMAAYLRLAGRLPGDTTTSMVPYRGDLPSIATLVDDAWKAFEIDYPGSVVDEDTADVLPPRTCGYDFFVVEASNRKIEDGWLAEWSNADGDCHQGVVRQYKTRAIADAWKAARSIAAAGGVCEKEN